MLYAREGIPLPDPPLLACGAGDASKLAYRYYKSGDCPPTLGVGVCNPMRASWAPGAQEADGAVFAFGRWHSPELLEP